MSDDAKWLVVLLYLFVLLSPWERLPAMWNRRKLFWRELRKEFRR